MTSFATSDKAKQAVQAFQDFDVDTQLALLWFGYLDIKEKLTPANSNASQTTAEAVFNRILAMSKEEQLQAQRDIAGHANTEISHLYGGLDPSAKLDVWLRLAQGMDDGRIIGMPEGYELPQNTKQFVDMVTSLEFEQRIEFTRTAVYNMGAPSN
jgi:Orange carotenoid protein, N-terminal